MCVQRVRWRGVFILVIIVCVCVYMFVYVKVGTVHQGDRADQQ